MLNRVTAVMFVGATLILIVTWMIYGALVNAYALFPRAPDVSRGLVVAFQAKRVNVYLDPFQAFFLDGLKWAGITAGVVAVAAIALRGRMPQRLDLAWLKISDVQCCFAALACVIALAIVGTAW